MNQNESLKRIAYYSIILAPILFFYYYIYNYTCNIPLSDDFDSPINSILRLRSSHNFLEQLKIIFEFHSDHRLIFLRLESLLYLFLFGKLNFQILTFINTLFLVPTFLIIVGPLLKNKKYLETAALAFCLFIFTYEDCFFWLHISSNYFPTLFFATLCIKYCSESPSKTNNLLITFCHATLVLFCFGNGIILFPIISILLVLKKAYKNLIYWAIVSGIVIKLYFLNYQKSDYLGDRSYGSFIFMKLKYICSLIASFNIFADFDQNFYLGLLVLSLILILFIYTKKSIYKPQNLFYLGLICFVGGTITVIVLGRFKEGSSYNSIAEIRYRFYGVMLLLSVLTFLFHLKSFSKTIKIFVLLLFISFNVSSFIKNRSNIDYYSKRLYCSSFNWRHANSGLYYYLNSEPIAILRLKKFEDLGYYASLKSILDSAINFSYLNKEVVPFVIKKNTIIRKFNNHFEHDKQIIITESRFDQNSHGLMGCYFMLKSKSKTFLFPSFPNKHQGKNFLKFGIGVSCEINQEFLIKDDYEVFEINILKNNAIAIYKTNEIIRI